jgi:4,5:9,10-diseco-3-hydroxy-5,9,17-trioxoandrosta-1(10),2-diene-4-oate hydrolase
MTRSAEEALVQSIAAPIAMRDMHVGDTSIRVAITGSGPPLLLLHGMNIGWGQWHTVIAPFAQHFRVIAVDLPGAGGSSRVSFPNVVLTKTFVDPIVDVLDQLNINRAHVVGHSLGGWIALKLALANPERMDRIVLTNPIGMTDVMPISKRPIALRWFAELISRTAMRPTRKNMAAFLKSACVNASAVSDVLIDYYTEHVNREPVAHPLLLMQRLAGLHRMDPKLLLTSLFPTIKNNICIVFGDADTLIPLPAFRRGASLLPNATRSSA